MQISLDYTNMMADAIGSEFGIHDEAVASLRTQTKEIHQRIHARRECGELPCFDLPHKLELLEEI